jgi:hypothetical protein
MLKEYNQAFGKNSSAAEERTAFINRADHLLMLVRDRVGDYDSFFRAVCFELGVRPSDFTSVASSKGSFFYNLGSLAGNDFYKMIEILLACLKTAKVKPDLFSFIDMSVQGIMDRSTSALGISYENGMFYPAGEPILDHDLINHSLIVLSSYPAEDKDLRLALDNYRAGKKEGIVETCYRCVEGIVRQHLKNNSTLIDNKPDLLKLLNLTDTWKKILAAYISFGNEYGRHASAERHDASETEVEAYLYQTCLLIRLIVKISK